MAELDTARLYSVEKHAFVKVSQQPTQNIRTSDSHSLPLPPTPSHSLPLPPTPSHSLPLRWFVFSDFRVLSSFRSRLLILETDPIIQFLIFQTSERSYTFDQLRNSSIVHAIIVKSTILYNLSNSRLYQRKDIWSSWVESSRRTEYTDSFLYCSRFHMTHGQI